MAGTAGWERLFREVARLDVDEADIERLRTFVGEKVDDITIAGRHAARWNGCDVIAPQDLPTEGPQEQIRHVGGLAVPLVQTFRIRDADVRNLSGRHWDRAFALFRLSV